MSNITNEKYAMYLRKSRMDIESEKLGEGETLERHYNILVRLAEKNNISMHQITIYKELVSGDSIADRPQMQKLLSDVYSGKYKGVLVVEIERLARGSNKDQGEVAETFKFSDTFIITPSKTYNPNNDFDEEYLEFGLFMSRREYKTITRRMTQGKISSLQEGNFIGSIPPFGFDAVRKHKKERILVENENGKYVRMMFEWFTKDKLTTIQIAKRLTDMGVKTYRNKQEWHADTVKGILKNEHYIGLVRWQCRKKTKIVKDGIMKKSNVRNKEYQVLKGKHKPIIDLYTFNAAQKVFKERYTPPVTFANDLINPLAGLLVCKACGKNMIYRKQKGEKIKDRFIHFHSHTCKVKSAPTADVIDCLIQALQAHISDFELRIDNNYALQEKHRLESILKGIEGNLNKEIKKRDNLFTLLEEGLYTKSEFMERKQIIGDTITKLNEEITTLKNQMPDQIDYTEKIHTFKNVIEILKDDSCSPAAKNQFLKQIINKITYDCTDLGFRRGGIPILEVFPKE